jgi:hypothetical protein
LVEPTLATARGTDSIKLMLRGYETTGNNETFQARSNAQTPV